MKRIEKTYFASAFPGSLGCRLQQQEIIENLTKEYISITIFSIHQSINPVELDLLCIEFNVLDFARACEIIINLTRETT